MKKYTGELLLFIVTFIAASGWFFSKYSLEGMPTMGFIGLRFTLACLIFLPLSFKAIIKLTTSQKLKAASVGLAYIVNMVLWITGLIYSEDLGEGAFLYSLAMLIAPVISWILFQYQPKYVFWFSLPLAISGLYFLSNEDGKGLHFSYGNILFLLASCSAALYFVLNNQFSKNIPTLSLTTIQLGVVGFLVGSYSLIFEKWYFPIPENTWFWFVGSTLIATNLRVFLQTVAQKYCGINNAAIIMLLEPIWTMVFSMIILNESMSRQKMLGCILILSALIVYCFPGMLKRRTNKGMFY
ncbi:DMT family transporter [Aggregatibacter actinomycetemcomitans]|uniref:DMT family transporter n=1 Tax=Aggregatibacter actinomycetemcomitans TaxID=714 RepID=UPI00197C0205|nr:DMT family transporter [Aggregatibacter actinomycetemcomitans]MBN6068114.1 DMT family transporter [Aggregatibacter actinomycetemcomitans]MBN6085990.1 DMT family transporter [Aggregatibacter actinomycetemcomitans]